jgi:hypothetical protein
MFLVKMARVQELFSSMRSPMSFADDCAVICIDGIDDNLVICEKQDATTNKNVQWVDLMTKNTRSVLNVWNQTFKTNFY